MDRRLFVPALVLACLLTCGCGNNLAPVSGTVVFPDGEPVRSGIVEFSPAEGGKATQATLSEEGTFTLRTGTQEGLAPGRYRVAIIQLASADGFPGHVRPHHRTGRLVHPRYRDYDKAQLDRLVEAGKRNDFRIEVEPSR